MKQKKILLILIFALVLSIGGGSILYTHLAKEYTPNDRLLTTLPQNEADGAEDPAPPASGGAEREESDASDPSENAPSEETVRSEPKAPDFAVMDAEGNKVRLSDYFGKPIVLNFWASWCGPCQMEMPDFHEKYQSLGTNVQFLMVNVTGGRETLATAKQFIAQNGYGFPVFFDTDGSASVAYRVYSLPTTYFIDADGYIIAQGIGAIDAQTLQQGIDMIR